MPPSRWELAPEFVHEDIKKESIQDPTIRDAIAKASEGTSHICIGLNTDGGLRFLDPPLFNSDAHYAHYTPLLLRQYLSMDYSNRGIVWEKKGEMDKAMADYTRAIALDSKYVRAIVNRSVLRIHVMDFRGATKDLLNAIKLKCWSYDASVRDLAKVLTPHWEQRDVKPMADRFYTDTSVKIAEAIARMILCYAFWLKGDKDEALENFSYLATELVPAPKSAPSTMEFLKKILDAMPGDMKRDKRAKAAIKTLNKYQ